MLNDPEVKIGSEYIYLSSWSLLWFHFTCWEIISSQSLLVYPVYIVYAIFMYKVVYICHFKKIIFTIGIIFTTMVCLFIKIKFKMTQWPFHLCQKAAPLNWRETVEGSQRPSLGKSFSSQAVHWNHVEGFLRIHWSEPYPQRLGFSRPLRKNPGIYIFKN